MDGEGLIINGRRVAVPGVRVVTWLDDERIPRVTKVNRRRASAVSAVVLHTSRGVVGVVRDGAGDDACIAGGDCTCADEITCSDECDGKGCAYTCTNAKTCAFVCTEGGCSVSADNAGAVSVDCPGGGCTLACTGASSCNISNCSDCVCSDDSTVSGICAP